MANNNLKVLNREDSLIEGALGNLSSLDQYDELQLGDLGYFERDRCKFKDGAKVDVYDCIDIPSDIDFSNCSVVWIDSNNYDRLVKEGKCNFGNAKIYVCPTDDNRKGNAKYYDTQNPWILPEDISINLSIVPDLEAELQKLKRQTSERSYFLVPDDEPFDYEELARLNNNGKQNSENQTKKSEIPNHPDTQFDSKIEKVKTTLSSSRLKQRPQRKAQTILIHSGDPYQYLTSKQRNQISQYYVSARKSDAKMKAACMPDNNKPEQHNDATKVSRPIIMQKILRSR